VSIADKARSRAYWEWLRTANPWLPPYERLTTALFNLNVSTRDLEMKVVLDWPSDPFRFDPWQDEVAAIFLGESAGRWDQLFDRAVRHILSAMLEHGTNDEEYRASLVHAAARVRAMAPEGTEWEEAWPTPRDGGRRYLRMSVLILAAADEAHDKADGDAPRQLKRVESYLHGLWLNAEEN
jgi:hypothetical protein